jgi:hypothetical protein
MWCRALPTDASRVNRQLPEETHMVTVHVVRRGAVPLLLALVGAGLAAAPAEAVPTWVAPVVTIAQGTNEPADSHLVVDGAGNAMALWVEQDGPAADDHVQVSTHLVGGSWSPPVDISAAGDIADGIDIATNASGYAVAVWSRSSGTNDVLEAATRSPGGAWSAAFPVGDSTVDAERPQVGVDAGGNAVVTFVAADAAPRTLRYATKPIGGPWSATDDLSDPAEGIMTAEYDLVVTPAGQATVAWQLYLPMPTDRRVIQSAVRQPGGSFSDPETISSASTNTWSPALAVNSAGVATATWYEDTATSTTDVRAATRTADGTWSAAEPVSAAGGSNGSADVVVDSSGAATAVWTRYQVGQLGKIQYSARPAGGTWSAPQDLTPPGMGGFNFPTLAIDGDDRITAAYVVNLSSGFVVAVSTRAPGAAWTTSAPLSVSNDGNASKPAVAVDASGQPTVTWTRTEAPPGHVLETRTLDTQGPLATGLSIPAATVGKPVTLAWPAVDAWSPVSSVTWSFADGTTGSGASLTREFGAVGSYAVSVTATDAVGNATTLTGSVTVSPAPSDPSGLPAAQLAKPALSGVKLTRKAIHVVGSEEKPRATKLKLTLSTDASVTVKLMRTGKVKQNGGKAKLVKTLLAGKRAIRLTSKTGGAKLPAGSYKITVMAKNSVGSSAVTTVKLRIEK